MFGLQALTKRKEASQIDAIAKPLQAFPFPPLSNRRLPEMISDGNRGLENDNSEVAIAKTRSRFPPFSFAFVLWLITTAVETISAAIYRFERRFRTRHSRVGYRSSSSLFVFSERSLKSSHSKTRYSFSPFLLFFSLLFLAIASGTTSEQLTAYEVLQSYGFPIGILPSGVQAYSLKSNGDFVVQLRSTCLVNIPDAYPVKYSSHITGRISDKHLKDLQGITVKVFLWWNIDAITVIGSDLSFSVGPLSASYPISNFSEDPECEGRTREEFLAVD